MNSETNDLEVKMKEIAARKDASLRRQAEYELRLDELKCFDLQAAEAVEEWYFHRAAQIPKFIEDLQHLREALLHAKERLHARRYEMQRGIPYDGPPIIEYSRNKPTELFKLLDGMKLTAVAAAFYGRHDMTPAWCAASKRVNGTDAAA